MIGGDLVSIQLSELPGVIREALREVLVEQGRTFDEALLATLASNVARALYAKGVTSLATPDEYVDAGSGEVSDDLEDRLNAAIDLDRIATKGLLP